MPCEHNRRIESHEVTTALAGLINTVVGKEISMVAEVIVAGSVPDDWDVITCASCSATGRVPPGTFPPGYGALCPDCAKAALE